MVCALVLHTVVSSANLMMVCVAMHSMHSWMNREYRRARTLRGTSDEDQCGRCVATYPHHLGVARQEDQDQVAERVVCPMVLSLLMSFEGTMVLNTEL